MTSIHHHRLLIVKLKAIAFQIPAVVTVMHVLLLIMPRSTVGSPFEPMGSASTRGCPESYKKFEIMSGFAFSSPADSFASIPGCLELTSCLSACRNNDSCIAVNFETGLCVLLSSSANQKPGSLRESQFPVFTIYAQKVCLSDYGKCSHSRKRRKETKGGEAVISWVYERVPGHQLALLPDSVVTTEPSSSSFYPDSPPSDAPSSSSSSLNEFATSSNNNWSPGLAAGSSAHPSPASVSSPASAASFPPDPTSISDYTTARNNFPKQSDAAIVQQELLPLKHKKVNSKKRRTRLSPSDQKVLEIRASSLLRCAEACLQESSFPCLSANFQRTSKKCTLMSFDRHSLAIDSESLKLSPEEKQELRSAILTASPGHDYIEMNCRGRNDEIAKADPSQGQFLCDFKPLPGLVLKTVDAIYEGVDSLSECKKKCLEAPFQCYSFDLGEDSSSVMAPDDSSDDSEVFGQTDPFSFDDKKRKKIKKRVKNSKRTSQAASSSGKTATSSSSSSGRSGSGEKRRSVCRISHLDRSALFHLQDPYSHLPGVTTYERNNCFNIQVHCGRDRMKALFSSTKSFTGKIYSARAPATCSQTLESKSAFSIDIPYFTAPSTMTTTTISSDSSIPTLTSSLFSRHRQRDSSSASSSFTDCGVTATSVRGGRHEEESVASDEIESRQVDADKSARALHHHYSEASADPLAPGSSSRPTFARFSVSLVLQRHALIVTSADFDITLNCDYNLSQQKIVSNSIQLFSHSPNEPDWNGLEEVQAVAPGAVAPAGSSSNKNHPHPANIHHPPHVPLPPPIPPPVGGTGVGSVVPVPHAGAPLDPLTHEATFHSPIVRMSITDRNGGPVRAAEVGDPLSLRFEVQSEEGRESMYDVFVKNIVADDGVDTSELELIDNIGCPTDPSIMGPLRRVHVSSISRKVLEAPFEAFKFPTSAIVQFRALIVPCIAGDCQPVVCTISSSFLTSSNLAGHPTFSSGSMSSVHSYGKRSVDMAAYARALQHSNETTVVPDMLLMPKELVERVFIEVLDKKEPEEEEDDSLPASARDAQGLELSPEEEENKSGSNSTTEDEDNNSSSNGRDRRRRKKESQDNCLNIPAPVVICCICLLCVQLICLMRFYFSNRDAKLRVRRLGFFNQAEAAGY